MSDNKINLPEAEKQIRKVKNKLNNIMRRINDIDSYHHTVLKEYVLAKNKLNDIMRRINDIDSYHHTVLKEYVLAQLGIAEKDIASIRFLLEGE